MGPEYGALARNIVFIAGERVRGRGGGGRNGGEVSVSRISTRSERRALLAGAKLSLYIYIYIYIYVCMYV
jgi:hypothetical protein